MQLSRLLYRVLCPFAALLVGAMCWPAWASTLPASIQAGMQDALEQRWLGAQAALERRVLRRAGEVAPERASELAELAGRQAQLTSSAETARDAHVRRHRALLADLVSLDLKAAEAAASAQNLAALRTAEQASRERASAVSELDERGRGLREAVVAAARDLETRVARIAALSATYQQTAAAVQDGSDPDLLTAEKVRADFNAELVAQASRESRERKSHEQATEAFRLWVVESEQRLNGAQTEIDAAFSAWRTVREKALGTGKSNAPAADDAGMAVSPEERARLNEQAEQARAALARAEQAGKALLAQIQAEHAARQAVLTDAGEALVARQAKERAVLVARRDEVQSELAALTSKARSRLSKAKQAIESGQAELLGEYGAQYAELHGAIAAWLRSGDPADLDTAPKAAGNAGSQMLRKARDASAVLREAAGLNASLAKASAALAAGSAAHQQREQALRTERDVLARRAAALEADYGRWRAPLATGRAEMLESLAALAKRTPALADLTDALNAGSAAIALLHRHLQAELASADDGKLDAERWQSIAAELSARIARSDGFDAGLDPLVDALLVEAAASLDAASVPPAWRSAVEAAGGSRGTADVLYGQLGHLALGDWALEAESDIWRLVDAAYRRLSDGRFEKQ